MKKNIILFTGILISVFMASQVSAFSMQGDFSGEHDAQMDTQENIHGEVKGKGKVKVENKKEEKKERISLETFAGEVRAEHKLMQNKGAMKADVSLEKKYKGEGSFSVTGDMSQLGIQGLLDKTKEFKNKKQAEIKASLFNEIEKRIQKIGGKDIKVDIQEDAEGKTNIHIAKEVNAKLFGFIPMHFTAEATMDSEGHISMKKPWYGFLMSGLKFDFVNSLFKASASGEANA